MLRHFWLVLLLSCCSATTVIPQPQQKQQGKTTMAYTYEQNFENAKSAPGSKVNTDLGGTGGDGVYDITEYGSFGYGDRQVYISDFANSGNRSLRHVIRDYDTLRQYGGEYTNAESTIAPPSGGYEDPSEGTELWARMMIYVPSSFDWRGGSSGNSSVGEPKLFRTFVRTRSRTNLSWHIAKPWGDQSGTPPSGYDHRNPVIGLWLGHNKGDSDSDEVNRKAPWYSGTRMDAVASWSKNDYSNYVLKFDRWVCLESYIYFSSNSSKGIVRGWMDEELLYEATTKTLKDTTKGSNVKGRPNIHTLSTWGSLPYKGGEFYTDDYIITTDSSKAIKTDSHGNKIVGRAGESDNGGTDPVDPPTDTLTISNHRTSTTIDSATLKWKTNLPSNTVVDYGPTEDRGTLVVDNELVTDHNMELSGLDKNTTYYYRFSSKSEDGQVAMDMENSTFTTKEEVVDPPTELPEHSLNEHTDVSLADPKSGDVFMYDGKKWVNNGNLETMIEGKVKEMLESAKIVV